MDSISYNRPMKLAGFLLLSVIVAVFNQNMETAKLVAAAVIVISVIGAWRVRNNWFAFIIYAFLAYSNYSICIASYLVGLDNFFTQIVETMKEPTAVLGMTILFIFTLGMVLIQPKAAQRKAEPMLTTATPNVFAYWILVAVLGLIFLFNFARPSEEGARGSGGTLYEYSIILFIIAFFYSGNWGERLLLLGILAAYALQELLYGGRIVALQLLILAFLLLFQHRVTVLQCLPVAVVGVLVLTVGGFMRGNFQLSADTLTAAWNSLSYSWFAFDTAYAAYHTSMTFLAVADIVQPWTRLVMLGKFFLSMVVGGSLAAGSNLPEYTHDFFFHYYGGMLPYYMYFYLGYPGVAGILLVIKAFMKECFVKSPEGGNFTKCVLLYLVATCPRWILYSPNSLIRGVMLLFVVHFCVKLFNKLLPMQIVSGRNLRLIEEER